MKIIHKKCQNLFTTVDLPRKQANLANSLASSIYLNLLRFECEIIIPQYISGSQIPCVTSNVRA